MKTKAVRLHAANDLRLDEFELPEIRRSWDMSSQAMS